jgi:alanyl-tRNA synthetase
LDGVDPSNKEGGYVLRRLIRRSVRFGKHLGVEVSFLSKIAQSVIETYKDSYHQLETDHEMI